MKPVHLVYTGHANEITDWWLVSADDGHAALAAVSHKATESVCFPLNLEVGLKHLKEMPFHAYRGVLVQPEVRTMVEVTVKLLLQTDDLAGAVYIARSIMKEHVAYEWLIHDQRPVTVPSTYKVGDGWSKE